MRSSHLISLLNRLSRAHHGRAVLLALGRSTQPEDVEIAALRTRIVAQGLTPIELAALEAEMRETAERLRKALVKNGVPAKYLGSLRGRRRTSRRREVSQRAAEAASLGPRRPRRSYRPFRTDKGVATQPSTYTERFHAKYGRVPGGIAGIARATHADVAPRVRLSEYRRALHEVFNRGLAAWATGHRPGATQAQWAYARVYSFVLGGKTRNTADADIARELRLVRRRSR